jgi:carbamoyltransferase
LPALTASFNLKGEPIVNSPFDAIKNFYTSGLDAPIIDRYLVVKATSPGQKLRAIAVGIRL